MKRSQHTGAAVVFLLGAAGIAGAELSLGQEPTDRALESAHERYTARLSANDAAAEEWRAAHGTGRPDAPPATEPPPDPRGCPEGTQVWQRDRITELCATLCESDRDCAPEEGRCRLLDLNESSESAPILLVDELPAEEVEAIELDETKPAPPVRVCDPFWDVEGATDADVVAMIE